ncbi:hypothetical protein [Nisaea sp.]|uniref:hypothetical protein n=1 Tax=Nisaea sp. TaxID=2024842 RepID=UPI002B2728A2|nr:hypothetical protein [Nisaea sp.]
MRTALITYSKVANRGGEPYFLTAGNRLRLVPAYNALLRAGFNPAIFASADEADVISTKQFQKADQVVFGKMVKPMYWLLEKCRDDGKRVIFDICDDPWDYPELHEMIPLAAQADFCTTSSDGLAAKLRSRLGIPIKTVNEPPDCTFGKPVLAPNDSRLRLLWYGSNTNAASLAGIADALAPLTADRRIELTILSAFKSSFDQVLATSTADFVIRFEEWVPDLQDKILAETDLVLIPKRNDGWSELKSANRLVTAIAAGRLAIAAPIPSYQSLAEWSVLTNDFLGGIRDVLARPDFYLDKLHQGQAYTRDKYDLPVIEAEWKALLT